MKGIIFVIDGMGDRPVKELGDKMSEDDLKEMIECATNNKGKLFFDDFYYIISKNS